MAEENKSPYKVKSRNEMKTMNVVFVSDDLVSETVVTKKEYDKAKKLKVKTGMEKPKVEEGGLSNATDSKKRKLSEGEECENTKRLKVNNDFESALSVPDENLRDINLSKRETKKRNTEKHSSKRDSEKKESEKKKLAEENSEKKESEKKEFAKKESEEKNSEKKELKKKKSEKKKLEEKSSEKKESEKKEFAKKELEEKNSEKKELKKKKSEKNKLEEKNSEIKDSGKKDSSKIDSLKKDSKKNDSYKMDSGKRDAEKKHSSKGESKGGKKDSSKYDLGKINEEIEKKSAKKERVNKEAEKRACAEQSKKIMADDNGASASVNDKYEMASRALFVGDEEALAMEVQESGTSAPEPDKVNLAEPEGTTMYSLRKVFVKDTRKVESAATSSDHEEEVSSCEGESSENSEESDEGGNNRQIKEAVAAARYFEAQSVKKNKTSDDTLQKLKYPKMDRKEVEDILSKYEISGEHQKCMEELMAKYVGLFEKWMFFMRNDYNIIVYGVGSKTEITKRFAERIAEVSPVIVVNGFFPEVSVREITERLCNILGIAHARVDIVEEIERRMKDTDFEIFILVNNIDGIMLRNKRTQNILSQYARIQRIHLFVTIDHVNAPLMWDKSTSCDFNWIWYDCPTYAPYTVEIAYEENILLKSRTRLTLASLRNVFNSLTSNSRSIFVMMVKRDLTRPVGVRKGISYKELYQASRRELLISSDGALRSLLKEFIDHNMLKQKRSNDGEEVFIISIDTHILKQFIEDYERLQ